jgi:Leucine-rich repeat (LRR) protein
MAEAKKETERDSLTFDEFVKRKPELTVLTDHPLTPEEAFEADTFNFRYKLGPIFDILRHPATKTPASILISGSWGTGKTSAMKWLQGLLDKWNETGPAGRTKVRPVWFYPWKYDNKEDVRKGLIAEVIINAVYIRNPENKKIIISSKKILTGLKLLGSFGLNVVSDLVSASEYEIPIIPGLKISGEAFKEIREHFSEAAQPEATFLNELEEAMIYWVKESLGKNQRMVILIDDLDRCMPDIALQVLEALKLYLNIPNLIFVLGVDKDVIGNLVVEYYKGLGLVKKKEKGDSEDDKKQRKGDEDKAKHYLSKMFQVEVELEPTEQQVTDFFEKQLTELPYWTGNLSDSEQQLFHDLVLRFAGRNPREVKRLLNSALMKGAGSVLIRKDGIKFNQGLQLFFVRRILDERFTMASVAGSKRGIEFFVQWSQIVCNGRKEDPNFPTTVEVPADFGKEPQKELDIEEKTRKRLDNVFAPFAREEYHELLKNWQFSGLLKLLADEDIGRLMQIEFPPEERAEEIAAIIGKSRDDDILREAIARGMSKPASQVTPTDYEGVTELDLSYTSVTDFMLLENLKNLQLLLLHHTQVTDVGPLASLANLQMLYLADTKVIDVSPLASLTRLQELDLSGTPVADVGPLNSLTNLQLLNLSGTKVTDIGPLASLVNIQWLNLGGTKVTDVGPLASLTNLQMISLGGTQVSDVNPLTSITKLQTLVLSGPYVTDFGFLSYLTNLKWLYIYNVHVTDVGPFTSLTNLQKLYLENTGISDGQVEELKKVLPKLQIYRR